jgi:hypothetical protein
MSTWYDSRNINEEQRHRESLAAVRRHPLAMDRATVQRLAADSLLHARPRLATIIQFSDVLPPFADVSRSENVGQTPGRQQTATGQPDRATTGLTLDLVARTYLRRVDPPNGYAKALAIEHGLNYQSLLNRISTLRAQTRWA